MASGTTSLPVRNPTSLPARNPFGRTMRSDRWWAEPLAVFLVFSTFIVYTTWAVFQGEYYTFGNYLSPYYSPELFGDSHHAWLGPRPAWWEQSWLGWLPWSPAYLILWAPLGFRLTCYYYRGAYYKAFWADPPSCAVGEPRKVYLGEQSFPLIVQNIHRYFLYVALIFIVILSTTPGRASGSKRMPAVRPSAWASDRSCWPSTWCCWRAMSSGATRCAIWSAADWTSSQRGRFASRRTDA